MSTKRASSRSHILAAAAEIFAEKGYEGASIDDIIARAGVARGTLYYNFGSKEAIAMCLATAGLAELDGELRPRLAAGGDPEELLHELMEKSCRWFIANKSVARVVLTAPLRDPALVVAPPPDRPSFRGLARDLVAQGQARGLFRTDIDATTMSQVIGGIFLQTVLIGIDRGADGLEAWLNSLLRVVFEGVRRP